MYKGNSRVKDLTGQRFGRLTALYRRWDGKRWAWVCHVWDWLTFHAPDFGFDTSMVAEVYGQDSEGSQTELGARTGCIGCPLAEKETALENLLLRPAWKYLEPLTRLKPLYRELREFHNRLRKYGETNKDGKLSGSPNRVGPLTMEARLHGLETVMGIQGEINQFADRVGRPRVDLINEGEFWRILELIDSNTWPNRWDGTEPNGAELLPNIFPNGQVQPIFQW